MKSLIILEIMSFKLHEKVILVEQYGRICISLSALQ